MDFFGEIHVFLQLTQKGLFGTNRAYLPLETPKLHYVFVPKTNSVLTGKKGAR
jgi:hypothetical protein